MPDRTLAQRSDPDDGEPGTTVEQVQHSGPNTKFCVLCLSGEHERVGKEAATDRDTEK